MSTALLFRETERAADVNALVDADVAVADARGHELHGLQLRWRLTAPRVRCSRTPTYVNGVSARPRVRTRLRTGTTLVVHGHVRLRATQSEAGCRFAADLWSTAYRIFIGFYNAKTRSLEDYYDKNHLTVANADGAADFIESYEAATT